LVRPSRAVSLVELSPTSPSAVKAKPPDACCSPDPASCFVSGSSFSVPQLVQNFSSAEISGHDSCLIDFVSQVSLDQILQKVLVRYEKFLAALKTLSYVHQPIFVSLAKCN